jgi:hypothetical protein
MVFLPEGLLIHLFAAPAGGRNQKLASIALSRCFFRSVEVLTGVDIEIATDYKFVPQFLQPKLTSNALATLLPC